MAGRYAVARVLGKPLAIGAALSCLSPALAPTAAAATATAPIAVSLTMATFCNFSAGNLAFGLYTGGQLDATGVVTVQCSNTTTYRIFINAGLHFAAAYDWNLLGPAGALLSYKVYRDSGRTVFWGGNPGYDTVDATANGGSQTFTMYGRIAAGQYRAPGAYADTVTFMLVF